MYLQYSPAIPKLCAAAHRGAVGYFKIFFPPVNFCVLFFQTATNSLGQTVIKLFGTNYFIERSVRYFFGLGAP